ncbi:RagB/SusD family nutrient uptake outer membrane protein [Chitinophaga varians]|uniref:RagB/SusD family nutrient uptake outer membrane protein n=1 Tax=Chitinophaga varians TaxID=2202339 RepID=UPI00165FDA12|nr:RagB/SusD family nutrient uptake outer membrane protein [Chitinophaga varians]MBC9909658.1 RagB/SusD family nutrient uptake outer membrane protein [Chitinophaga varians]
MRKLHKHISFALLLTLSASCNKDFLERKAQDIISDDAAYGSVSGVQALTANLYNNMQTEAFDYWVEGNQAAFPSQASDEAVRSYSWGATLDPILGDEMFGWWRYDFVRNVNDFIEKIPLATNISEEQKTRFLAEARFVRAFYYFSLVKRYGGVPLITKVQQYNGNLEELKVPRNKEQEVYDFIASELDAITGQLPESYGADERYRATRYAALALKCRAMLYAASVAKYGSVQLGGAVGIAANADGYWQKAYDAAQLIINSGKFQLFNGYSDKTANFQQLFLTGADLDKNKEAIFVKAYQSPDLAHGFDFYNAPQSFKIDYGCATNPTLELVESFEYTDGTPGKLKINDAAGNPIPYKNTADLFKDKDPRFLASILYPGAPWQGGTVELRRGVIDNGVQFTSANLTDTYGSGANSIPRVGKDGPLLSGDPTKTGFYVKKFMDPVNRLADGRSTTPWIVFRYGEVLLNYAEAAIELGKTADALNAINLLRDRAGIKTLSNITRDQVRHERQVELAFENHRWWDICRWRTATDLLNNTQFHALYPWLMWENGKSPADMQYTFQIVPAPKNTRTFLSRMYYQRIPTGEIDKNSNLLQNPGF